MARKNKRFHARQQQANAPELQVLQQQPPHNPYYPDLPSHSVQQLVAPPTYSESTVPLAAVVQNSRPVHHQMSQTGVGGGGASVNYSRYQDYPNQQGPSVVIQQVPYNHRAERYRRKVRSFNNQLLTIAILAAISSIWAYNLYKDRPCLFDFTVHKPDKDIKISISMVRDMHLNIAFASGFIVLLCLIKSATGFQGKSYKCFLFLTGLVTFFTTLSCGYLAYLAFYSPCAVKTNEIFTNLGRTLLGSISNSLPSPDKGFFAFLTSTLLC